MKILIWGTGKIATHYMKFDFFSGHDILGFVDSYAEKNSFMGFPVYRPNDIGKVFFDYLIICVLKDNDTIIDACVVEHIDLKKVILINSKKEIKNVLKENIEQILDIDNLADKFPLIYKQRKEVNEQKEYYKNDLNREMIDNAFIQGVGDNHVIVWIPIELIFSEKREDNYLDSYTEEWILQNEKWENLPLISFTPYRSLFLFFMRGEVYPELYCKWYQGLYTSRGMQSGYTNEGLIEKRFREFKLMQSELNKGMEFFIENSAVAKWNDRGYFNLIDGHHRTSFLYYCGLTRMPVQITLKDYKLWLNKAEAEEVADTIIKQQRDEFYQPILNPYFLNLHPYREDYAKSRLHHLLEIYGAKRFVGKSIIDIGANLGYMGQAFYRMGAEVTLLEPDNIHYELLKKINRLLYSKCEVIAQRFEEYKEEKCFEVAILLTVLYHYMSDEAIRDRFVYNINKYVSQMIIWESGNRPDEEKEYIIQNTRFHNYRHISYTYATGRFRELGIFMTDDSEFLQV